MNAPDARQAGDFDVHQENDEVNGKAILVASGAAIVVGAVGIAGAWLLLVASVGTSVSPPSVSVPRSIANIEQTPIWVARDGLDLRAKQKAALATWGWADRDAGIATIPIDLAIDLAIPRESR